MIVIFSVALLVRILFLWACRQHPAYWVPLIDATTYDHFARQWVETGARDSTTAWHGAFYPLFLSLVYAVGTPSVLLAKSVQAILGALTCAGIGQVARLAFDRRAGWIAGLGAALYGPFIFYDLELMPAGWSVLWSTLMLGHLLRPIRRPVWRGAAHGMLTAGALLTRPELAVGYGGGLLLRFLGERRDRTIRRPSPAPVLVTAVIVFSCLTVPVALFNQPFTGQWRVLPANGGLNLYLANAESPCATMRARPGPQYDRIVNLPKRAGHFTIAEQNTYYMKRVGERLVNQPMRFFGHWARKAYLLLNGRETPTDLDIYSSVAPSRIVSALVWAWGPFGFPFSLLLPLAVMGFGAHNRKRLTGAMWTYGILACVLVVYMPTARYRLPLVPFLLVLAAGGLSQLIARNRPHPLQGKRGLTLWTVAAIGLQFAPVKVCPIEWDFDAERQRMIAQRQEDPARARSALMEVATLNPHDPQTPFFIALAEWELNHPDEALDYVGRALTLAPDYVQAFLLKADVLMESDRHDEAIAALRAATASAPDHAEAWMRLGTAQAIAQQNEAALRSVQRALTFEPKRREARLLQAELLRRLGRHEQVVSILEQLIRQSPDNPNLRVQIIESARTLGDEARARHHALEAQRLLPHDPRLESLMNGSSDAHRP